MRTPNPTDGGLVLCVVAGHPVAVLAREVTRIDDLPGQAPYAGVTLGVAAPAPATCRSLWCGRDALAVDTLEVLPDEVALLPAPSVLAGAAPWVVGFVHVRERLWPVVSLPAWRAVLPPQEAA